MSTKGEMREDLRRAVALVRKGLTQSEAGRLLGLTKNQVAGACDRAGLKFDAAEHSRRVAVGHAFRKYRRAQSALSGA